MAKMTVSAMVEGGKATMTPVMAQQIGPSGVNPGQVLASVNEKTKAFTGMTVPVKIIVDKDSKTFEIEVGTPPVSSLIKGQLGITAPVKEEAGVKGKKTIGNLTFDQAVKVASMKRDGTLAKTLKAGVMEVLGTCVSLGVTVEGKKPQEVQAEVKEGKWDSQVKE